jgi:DNA repair exonuclease SbcCD ATPase subunit
MAFLKAAIAGSAFPQIDLKRPVFISKWEENLLFFPQFLDLKVKNMTTFPQDLHISFKPGINLVFGGNYSGKTTIMNAIRFGVFGLSWGHTTEGIEKRYFSSRIREVQRKSLEISALFKINPMTVSVRRTVFSSGTAEIEAQSSKGSASSLSKLADSVKLEKQYYSVLREYMGQINEEQLRFIPRLIFAEEDRKCILWSESLEDFVLGLLISQKSANQLKRIESQLVMTKEEVQKLQQDRERITKRISEQETIQKLLQRRIKEYQDTRTEKIIQEYKKIESELRELRSRLAQLNTEIQNKLQGKSDLLLKLNATKEAIRQKELEADKVQERWLKAILNPKSPEESHFSKYLYYNKECPFCLANLSKEIDRRIESKVCLFCGKSPMPEVKVDSKKIEHELSMIDEERKKMTRLSVETEGELEKIDGEIVTLTKSRDEKNLRDIAMSARVNEFKNIEEKMFKKEAMSHEIEVVQADADRSKKAVAEVEANIRKVEAELAELSKAYESGKIAMRSEADTALGKIRTNFSTFVSLATNNEASGSLSTNLVPVLNGRRIFHQEFCSQFEKTVMDYAFRTAVLAVISENTKSCPSLVIETPDEVTDDSYVPHLANALLTFSSKMSLIITTVNMEMMKQLLASHKSQEKARRLTNLVTKGTPTQRSFYQIPLKDYIR